MPELDFDAITDQAKRGAGLATEANVRKLIAEIRRLKRSVAVSWQMELGLARKLTEALGLDSTDPDVCVPGCDEPGGLEHDLWHLVQQRDDLQARVDAAPELKERFAELSAQRDLLRAAVDAALAICAEYTEVPPPAKPEPCDDACDGYCHHDARFATADRIARELRRSLGSTEEEANDEH